MEVNFEYMLTKDEIINFHVKNAQNTKFYKKRLISQIFIFLVLGMILWSINIYLLAIIIILVIFNKKIILDNLKKNYYTYYSSNKYSNSFQETVVTINDFGIKHITNLGEKTYKWISVKSIYIVEGSLSSDTFMIVETYANEDLIISLGKIYEFESKKHLLESIVNAAHLNIIYRYPSSLVIL